MTRPDDDALRETTIASEVVFDGVLLSVRSDRIRLPDGRESVREWIDHSGAVLVVAEQADGQLVFVRQYRYAVGRAVLELPAGRIDPGEDPETCGRRELREETGFEARQWQHLGTIEPCFAYSSEVIDIYLARELTAVGTQLDDDEFLEPLLLSRQEAEAAARDGRITDAKTIAALFLALPFLGT